MNLKFRNSESLDEIRNIIRFSEPATTIVWQNIGEQRNVYNCNLINIGDGAQDIKFHLKKYEDTILVDRPIYVKLSYNQSLFKGEVSAVEQNVVSVQLPQLVKTLELRQFSRECFLPKEEKKVSMEVATDMFEQKKHKLTFTLLDISNNGLSVIVSENNYALMKNFDHFELKSIGSKELDSPILLDKRYNQKFRYRSRGKVINANRFGFKSLAQINQSHIGKLLMG